jgi:hypothetical protein
MRSLLGLTKLMDEQHPDDAGYAVVLGKPDFSYCVGLHAHNANAKERFSLVFRDPDNVQLEFICMG